MPSPITDGLLLRLLLVLLLLLLVLLLVLLLLDLLSSPSVDISLPPLVSVTTHASYRFQMHNNCRHRDLYRSHASGSINPWNGFVVVMCISFRAISNNSAVPG
jgi:hypothetical protein